MRRRLVKSVVKTSSSTVDVPMILTGLSTDEAGGIDSVAVKCIDTTKNTDSEGSLLDHN